MEDKIYGVLAKYGIDEPKASAITEDLLFLCAVGNCLPSKSDTSLELANHQNKWAKSHTDKENGIYALGFRHCFHFISDWVKQNR